ncbi:MAG: protein adenylyltransferase SelO family protein, partial [Xenococcaceae cyanobacterium]
MNARQSTSNPFFYLNYESALESLDNDFFDPVQPANFSQLTLRFRNNNLLPILDLDSATVTDKH